MYCPECGTQNSEPANFCQNCGLTLDTSKERKSKSSGPVYEKPDHSNDYRSPAPILDDVEDADVADFRDSISATYYILAFLLWPVGFILWAFHRENKPESAKNILAATLSGMVIMILVLLL